MFNNIGSKIKTLAKVISVIGIICSLNAGLSLIATDDDLVLTGLIILFVGCLVSWIGGFFTYGFGQLIENTDILVVETRKKASKTTEENTDCK